MKTKRLFTGIPLSTDNQNVITKDMQKARGVCSGYIRWIPAVNYHFTLCFLGNTHSEKVESITEKIKTIAQCFPAFLLQVSDYLYFPGKRPRMIWARAQLHPLFDALSMQLHKQLNINRSAIAPVPHITLARLKNVRQTAKVELPVRREPLLVEANRLVLWESLLSSAGADYRVLCSIPFTGLEPLTTDNSI